MGKRLDGKVAVITGAASGIGAETARLFGSEGATVIVADVNGEGAEAVVGEIRGASGRAEKAVVDIGDPQGFEALLKRVAAEHGSLDVLVNCAFRMVAGPLESLSTEDWHRCLDVTLHGTFFGVRAALRLMRAQQRGAIVNFSSLAGQGGQASMGGYGAAKAALENLTRTAAVEGARAGIRVNAVAPGVIATSGTLEAYPEGTPQRRAVEKMVPTGRMIRPREVANVVLFLASDEASGVNGQVINVDSGQSASLGAPEIEEGWEH
jgi:meso-butanediol dehydrogenase/(S,S)-butanediol dehydrogenase/diacetyl reductase